MSSSYFYSNISKEAQVPRTCDHCGYSYTFPVAYHYEVRTQQYRGKELHQEVVNEYNKISDEVLKKHFLEEAQIRDCGVVCPRCRKISKICADFYLPEGLRKAAIFNSSGGVLASKITLAFLVLLSSFMIILALLNGWRIDREFIQFSVYSILAIMGVALYLYKAVKRHKEFKRGLEETSDSELNEMVAKALLERGNVFRTRNSQMFGLSIPSGHMALAYCSTKSRKRWYTSPVFNFSEVIRQVVGAKNGHDYSEPNLETLDLLKVKVKTSEDDKGEISEKDKAFQEFSIPEEYIDFAHLLGRLSVDAWNGAIRSKANLVNPQLFPYLLQVSDMYREQGDLDKSSSLSNLANQLIQCNYNLAQFFSSTSFGNFGAGLSTLEKDLIDTNKEVRQAALTKAINMRNREALDAVEASIKRLTGQQSIEFYQPGGWKAIHPQEAYNQILTIARGGKFADDPALIQSLIPSVSFLNQDLMTELESVNEKALAVYQLLGVQMQLKAIVK